MVRLILALVLIGCASFKPRITNISIGNAVLLYEAQEEEINAFCRQKGGFDFDVVGCWIPKERTIYCSIGVVGCLEHESCHAKGLPREVCEQISTVKWSEYYWYDRRTVLSN